MADVTSNTNQMCDLITGNSKKTLVQCAISKCRVSRHKIAHLATSRWHRTEQHAIERPKYPVWATRCFLSALDSVNCRERRNLLPVHLVFHV